MTSSRRFPPPWQVEQIPGGFKVLDANGQALVYIYARETRQQADIAKVLTFDEARRIAVNVAKLPGTPQRKTSVSLKQKGGEKGRKTDERPPERPPFDAKTGPCS